MNLFITRSDTGHQEMDEIISNSQFLLHDDDPADFYRKYEDDGFIPKAGISNLRNLFDDSDIKDDYWLNIARKFLRSC